jgi:mono/diheme cytochrome c family protein
MRARDFFGIVQLAAALCAPSAALAAPDDHQASLGAASAALLERGRYMVVTGHCNNCHTAGYAANAGGVPEEQWLLGNPVGWRGEACTAYAPNLRLYVQSMPVDAWLVAARNSRPRAPMPWWSLRDTSDQDLIAMYWYMRSLQPVGSPAPPFLPSDRPPAPPYNQLPDLSLAK